MLNESQRTSQELKDLNLQELQAEGLRKPSDLRYRVEVARRMADYYNADKILLFDDVVFAVPEAQRSRLHALPGYERALLPGLVLAPGFQDGAAVLVAAPPHPVELRFVKGIHNEIQRRLSRAVPFQILFEYEGAFIDLLKYSEEEYDKLCEGFACRLNDEDALRRFTASYHLDLLIRQSRAIFDQGRILVSPFQVTKDHASALAEWVVRGAVALPDEPDLDKARNNFRLRMHEFQDVPQMFIIASDGRVIDSLSEREEDVVLVQTTEESIRRFAEGILFAVDRLSEQGKQAYIKLDSRGVSGLGNIAHNEQYSLLYDRGKDRSERLAFLCEIIRGYGYNTLPRTAVVEEFIQAKNFEGVKQDVTVGGMMVDGVFMPLSIFSFGVNENDEYICGWMGSTASSVREDEQLWRNLFLSFAKMGNIMSRHGYRNGILAGDALISDQGIYVHDYNFRRGGRSYLEALLPFLPTSQGLFEAQIELTDIPQGWPNEERYRFYTNICSHLFNDGIVPFSTSFGYFGGDHDDGHPDFLKFKLAIPLSHHTIAGKRRGEHLRAVRGYMEELTRRHV